MKRRYLRKSISTFFRRLRKLFFSPVFLGLSLFGNLVIVTSATTLYYLEKHLNPNIHSLLDTIWWSVSTVTTVGYGDVSPITPIGRVVGIFTMIVGTALFWSYTALFAEALLDNEITDIEDELRSIEKRLRQMTNDETQSSGEVHQLVQRLAEELKHSNRTQIR